jgi:serine/threonine-protein kinase RsbW
MAPPDRLEEITLQLPMLPGMELEASRAASELATSMQMSPDKVDAVRHAVVEAFINASEHSDSRDRTVYLTFEAHADALRIVVEDRGHGFSPEDVEPPRIEEKLRAARKRGWGLKIIQGLMDEVEIRSSADGTTIRMSKLR